MGRYFDLPMEIGDMIYEILIKLQYTRRDVCQWRLVSSRFCHACYRLLAKMTAPTHFVVSLDNQELKGQEFANDGASIVDLDVNSVFVVTKENQNSGRTTWIVLACIGGYIVTQIKTTKKRYNWSYDVRRVEGSGRQVSIATMQQKFSSCGEDDTLAVGWVKTGCTAFQLELKGEKASYIMKVIGRVLFSSADLTRFRLIKKSLQPEFIDTLSKEKFNSLKVVKQEEI